mgnify:CR=1 FL=1
MNPTKLFKKQKTLRDKIIKQHNLQGKALLKNYILALQVEIGELANEWRGFKHWSLNKKMNRYAALEEFADCLSFILEIGLEIDVIPSYIKDIQKSTITDQFNELYYICANLLYCYEKGYGVANQYYYLFEHFIGLGRLLGFTRKEIEQAYIRKNVINQKRQGEGY